MSGSEVDAVLDRLGGTVVTRCCCICFLFFYRMSGSEVDAVLDRLGGTVVTRCCCICFFFLQDVRIRGRRGTGQAGWVRWLPGVAVYVCFLQDVRIRGRRGTGQAGWVRWLPGVAVYVFFLQDVRIRGRRGTGQAGWVQWLPGAAVRVPGSSQHARGVARVRVHVRRLEPPTLLHARRQPHPQPVAALAARRHRSGGRLADWTLTCLPAVEAVVGGQNAATRYAWMINSSAAWVGDGERSSGYLGCLVAACMSIYSFAGGWLLHSSEGRERFTMLVQSMFYFMSVHHMVILDKNQNLTKRTISSVYQ